MHFSVTIPAVRSQSSLTGMGGQVPGQQQQQQQQRRGIVSNDTLAVALGVAVFMVIVWLYAVNRLYINHMDLVSVDGPVLQRDA